MTWIEYWTKDPNDLFDKYCILEIYQCLKNRNKIRNDVIKDIRLLLGDGMIDIELDPEHYDVALDVAISKVRQRSENSVEEDFYAIELQKEVAEYTLEEIMK